MTVTMERPPRKKRLRGMPWWLLPNPPFCPQHKVPLIVYTTEQLPGGMVRQYRKCPHCGVRTKSVYRTQAEAVITPQPLLFSETELESEPDQPPASLTE